MARKGTNKKGSSKKRKSGDGGDGGDGGNNNTNKISKQSKKKHINNDSDSEREHNTRTLRSNSPKKKTVGTIVLWMI